MPDGTVRSREIADALVPVVRRLLDLACQHDKQFSSLQDVEWLTHFAVEVRYPGYELKPTAADAADALARAARVFRFALDRLPSEVQP
jgi:hypothetical protein